MSPVPTPRAQVLLVQNRTERSRSDTTCTHLQKIFNTLSFRLSFSYSACITFMQAFIFYNFHVCLHVINGNRIAVYVFPLVGCRVQGTSWASCLFVQLKSITEVSWGYNTLASSNITWWFIYLFMYVFQQTGLYSSGNTQRGCSFDITLSSLIKKTFFF